MSGACDTDHESLVALAESAEAVRGYGEVKERSIAAWRARAAILRRSIDRAAIRATSVTRAPVEGALTGFDQK